MMTEQSRDAPTILACDTTQQACSVALLMPDGAVLAKSEIMARGHAEILPVMLDDIMRQGACDFAALDRLAVTVGPGTFAGVRVGLAAMRAIALACPAEIYPVTTTHAMACTAAGLMDEPLPLGVAIDARRGQLYTHFFDAGAKPLAATLADPQAINLRGAAEAVELFSGQFDGPVGVLGTGAAQLAAIFNDLPDTRLTPQVLDVPDMPDPAVIARMVAGQTAPASPAPVEPLYLRPPDAALPATGQQVARK